MASVLYLSTSFAQSALVSSLPQNLCLLPPLKISTQHMNCCPFPPLLCASKMEPTYTYAQHCTVKPLPLYYPITILNWYFLDCSGQLSVTFSGPCLISRFCSYSHPSLCLVHCPWASLQYFHHPLVLSLWSFYFS